MVTIVIMLITSTVTVVIFITEAFIDWSVIHCCQYRHHIITYGNNWGQGSDTGGCTQCTPLPLPHILATHRYFHTPSVHHRYPISLPRIGISTHRVYTTATPYPCHASVFPHTKCTPPLPHILATHRYFHTVSVHH
jgi:hypothetical protein